MLSSIGLGRRTDAVFGLNGLDHPGMVGTSRPHRLAKPRGRGQYSGMVHTAGEPPPPGDITSWLRTLQGDGPAATEPVYGLLYAELHRQAGLHIGREPEGQTLGTTTLVHEAWLRLTEQHRTVWRDRSHFLAIASTMMRRILIDRVRAQRAAKRDASVQPLSTTVMGQPAQETDPDLLAVHEALQAFEAIDPRAARVVELRFFGGLGVEEVAQVLSISPATVKRDWTAARAWLQRELNGRTGTV
jgi:RNA polymerase sigma factor (TIGR02999 family)